MSPVRSRRIPAPPFAGGTPPLPGSRFAVLADDLTGAFDVAEHAVDLFPSIRVYGGAPAFGDEGGDESLAVVSTGTRHLGPRQAAEAAAAALARLAAAGRPLLFAKFDSTLRGNIRAELARLAAGRPGALFCPANPALGRRVEGGRLLVDGVPVEGTVYGRDPKFPGPGERPACADARCDADLERLAGEAEASGALPAGSSAFFRAVARRAAPPGGSGRARGAHRPGGAVFFLNGSLNPVSADDEAPLLGRGAAARRIDDLPAGPFEGELVVRTRETPGYAGLAPWAPALLDLIRRGRFATLVVSGGETLAEFLRLAGIGAVTVASSVAPGIPAAACRVAGREFDLVPKPGGFPLAAALRV